MLTSDSHQSTASAAEKVVSAEVKVCRQDRTSAHGKTASDKTASPDPTPAEAARPLSPEARAMGEELYKNLTMGTDAYLHMLPRVEDSRIKTDITEALNRYESMTARVKTRLTEGGIEPQEESMLAKMSARAGMAMNAMKDATDSHMAEMMIEGCTMSVTTATKLAKHAEGKAGCEDFIHLCREWVAYEEEHMERLKNFL